MNQRPLFDLSRIPSHPAAPDDAPPERKYADLSLFQNGILSIIRRGTFVSFQSLQDVVDYYTLADWWELHLAGYVATENGETVITPQGIEYLTERRLI